MDGVGNIEFLTNLAGLYWRGYFAGDADDIPVDAQQLVDQNHVLIQGVLRQYDNPDHITPEVLHLIWPVLAIVRSTSPQIRAAFDAFLRSPAIRYVLANQSDASNPERLVAFIEYWAPAIRFFVDRGLIEQPQYEFEKVPPEIREVWRQALDARTEAAAFLDADRATKLELAQNRRGREDLLRLVVPIHYFVIRVQEMNRKCLHDAALQEINSKAENRGVSMFATATILNDGDVDLAREMKSRWLSQRAVKRPTPIGFCQKHKQMPIFTPLDLVNFIKRVDGDIPKANFLQHLNAIAKPPRKAETETE